MPIRDKDKSSSVIQNMLGQDTMQGVGTQAPSQLLQPDDRGPRELQQNLSSLLGQKRTSTSQMAGMAMQAAQLAQQKALQEAALQHSSSVAGHVGGQGGAPGSPITGTKWGQHGRYLELQPIMIRAAQDAGVPVSWATNPSFVELIGRESSWNPTAQNPTSSAHGLFQFLNMTRSNYGIPKTNDPYIQAVAGFKYIRDRYGTPEAALAFHNRNNWY